MAFAGWRPDDDGGVRDVVLVCDPGDNVLAQVVHAWDAKPTALPVHFGRQRPTIVLAPAGVFTITGAVVVTPRAADRDSARMEETGAVAMPDLSQDFAPQWPGLCGPTSGADVLFSMRERAVDVLDGFERGPGPAADDGVARLVAGGRAGITETSLAGRMGIAADDRGATNEGIRRGLASWLDETDPGAWDVRLDWFDDARAERGRGEQREFLGRLAAAVHAGGGAILCLWPGAEFADQPIEPEPEPENAEAADPPPNATRGGERPAGTGRPAEAGRPPPRPGGGDAPPLPDAGFPSLPPMADRPEALPGRPGSIDPRGAVATAERKLDAARKRLQGGDPREALDLAAEAVSLLHEAARFDPAAREPLVEALELCRACDRGLPSRGVDPEKPTTFE